jgi:hypothetical protein
MTAQRYALVIGLAVFVVGLVLGGIVAVSVTGDMGAVSCGVPWRGTTPTVYNNLLYGAHATDYSALCTSARQARGTIALVLLGIGAVVAGLYFVKRPATTAAAPTEADAAQS